MYKVVKVRKGTEPEDLKDPSGKRVEFMTGSEARDWIQNVADNHPGFKLQPRIIKGETNWKEREKKRFKDGTYTPVPKWFPTLKHHFAHVCLDDPSKLRYTRDDAEGERDKHVNSKPGAYLRRYFGNKLDPAKIAKLAARYGQTFAPLEVKFAYTPDEIERVYRYGPNSCMAGSPAHWNLDKHPARAYGAGDLAVAYLENGEGKITARAVCWPKKKVFIRVYGDENRLWSELETLGFKRGCHEDFTGARMLKIDTGRKAKRPDLSNFLGPYNDLSLQGIEKRKYFYLAPEGDVAFGEGGRAVWITRKCTTCKERTRRWEQCRKGRIFCRKCFDRHGFECAASGKHFCSRHHMIRLANGLAVHSRNKNKTGICEATNERYLKRHLITLHDGTVWCSRHFKTHGFTCKITGKRYRRSEGRRYDDMLVSPEGDEALRTNSVPVTLYKKIVNPF